MHPSHSYSQLHLSGTLAEPACLLILICMLSNWHLQDTYVIYNACLVSRYNMKDLYLVMS